MLLLYEGEFRECITKFPDLDEPDRTSLWFEVPGPLPTLPRLYHPQLQPAIGGSTSSRIIEGQSGAQQHWARNAVALVLWWVGVVAVSLGGWLWWWGWWLMGVVVVVV